MSISRREFLQAAVATSAILGSNGTWTRAWAQQSMTENALLDIPAFGNITLAHITDCHAQLKPIWFREPSVNVGVGEVHGLPPHVTGKNFLDLYQIAADDPLAYALTSNDFTALARSYGRMGGMAQVSTAIRRIRSDRPDTILLDGGDTWQGSYTSLVTEAQDMVTVMNALHPDAMTAHWEFTYGIDRVEEILESLDFPMLGANIFDNEWEEPAFESTKFMERGGIKIAIIGQAFPYMPIANPGWMFPGLSFGIREERMQDVVNEARDAGASLVVLLSHNGFDVDRKLASRVEGIDVILCGHTHDALPEPVQVNNTFLIASGSHAKFVSRIDIDADSNGMKGLQHRLIPIFSDVISPDPEMAALVEEVRAPYEDTLAEVLGQTESLLYRRGNVNGTFDDLILDALLEQRDAEIALSPGFRWGSSLLPGDPITREDVYNATGMTYPAAYRSEMSGEFIHTILEDVADNLFNPDPYYQQGGDMVRVGGMGYHIDVSQPIGSRISNMTLLSNGEAIDPTRTYVVAGWASVNEETVGPPIYDVVEAHIKQRGTIKLEPNRSVVVSGL